MFSLQYIFYKALCKTDHSLQALKFIPPDCQFYCEFFASSQLQGRKWVLIYSSNNYLLSPYCVPSTVHRARDTTRNKTHSYLPRASDNKWGHSEGPVSNRMVFAINQESISTYWALGNLEAMYICRGYGISLWKMVSISTWRRYRGKLWTQEISKYGILEMMHVPICRTIRRNIKMVPDIWKTIRLRRIRLFLYHLKSEPGTTEHNESLCWI